MRILIVEDELSKKENIISLVEENFPKSILLEAHSVKSAKILLKSDLFFFLKDLKSRCLTAWIYQSFHLNAISCIHTLRFILNLRKLQ